MTTPPTRAEWIAEYVAKHGDYGQCRHAVEEMRKAFPELSQVHGYVHCAWGKRGHFWLTTPDGEIVDPTRSQFPGPVEYDPWKPGDEVAVGKCMNCGEIIWRSVQSLENVQREDVCGDGCEEELRRAYA